MKLQVEEGRTIQFYKTKMIFKVNLEQSDNAYSTILMIHPPLVGPALHMHPNGVETFFVIEGDYEFNLNGQLINAKKGDFVYIPKNVPHKYNSGKNGGTILVTTPASVENYFLHIAEKLLQGNVPLEYEFDYAQKNGQVFLENTGNWGHK
ncbi:MAG: cupin domain-containing protein [Bacteroidetes bacterium]|nr:cupin domain-containing protein [Bacteroidota bacterium]